MLLAIQKPSDAQCYRPHAIPASALFAAALIAAGALSQSQVANAQATETAVEEVVVTGSRIIRDGYNSPTPVTVISRDWLDQNTATANLADTLNTLPVFAVEDSPAVSANGASAAAQGMNILNLRGMGTNRTLTLFDGQRSVPSMFSGEVDVNNFPQQLIERVETVTGGASAVYGSDAVAGVVNLILNRDFTGFRADVSAGETSYGDDENHKISLTGGFPFAGGRGHVLLSGETARRDGITPGAGSREWNRGGWGIMVDPNYTPGGGTPEFLVRPEVALSNAHPGGIIVSGPLRGTAFGSGGQPFQLNYGPIVNDPWMQGGDWRETEIRHDLSGTLEPENERNNLFGRVAYDLSDNLNVFFQASWGDNETFTGMWPPFQAGNGPTILSGNPFIPASVQAQMDALGLASFRLGSMNREMGTILNLVNRETTRYVAGAEGDVTMLGDSWAWNAYVQYGETESRTDISNLLHTGRYALAHDAVLDPNTNEIVCRVALTDPSTICVPWNPMGYDINTQAARDYILGTSSVVQTLEQTVVAGSIAGDPFSTPAGPVSLALSAEFREETAKGRPSRDFAGEPDTGGLFAGNFSAFDGKNDVWEAAIETVVPLANSTSGIGSLDLHGAFRYTDYKFSGGVNTWKIGAVWAPSEQLRFRATQSRDIRAPNFNELLAVSSSGFRSAFDPFTNTTPQFMGENSGNPNLDPEEGDTFEAGVVWQPAALSNFSASLDYWNIEVSGAIESPSDNETLQFCFNGVQEFCDRIERDANNVVTLVRLMPINLAFRKRSGIDVDLTQYFDVGPGQLDLRALGTYYLTADQDDGRGEGEFSILGNVGTGVAGSRDVGPPKWRASLNAVYTVNKTTAGLTFRGISDGYLNTEWVECLTNCPASTPRNRTIEDNSIDGAIYIDGALSHRFDLGGGEMELFLNVRNLLDEDPPIMPQGPVNFTYVMTLARPGRGHDVLGRVYLLGFRYNMQ